MTTVSESHINVLIGESHGLIALGLSQMIESQPSMRLLACVDCFEKLLTLAEQHQPDIILVYIGLKHDPCLQHLQCLVTVCPQTKVLVMTSGHDDQTLLRVFQLGLAGIIDKTASTELIPRALQAVQHGGLWFDRQLPLLLRTSPPQATTSSITPINFTGLTPREASVAQLARQGLPAKKIALELGLSEKTVRNQLTVIYEKLQVNNQVQLCLHMAKYQKQDNHP